MICDSLRSAVASIETEGGMSEAEKAYIVELKKMGRTLKNNFAPSINQVCKVGPYLANDRYIKCISGHQFIVVLAPWLAMTLCIYAYSLMPSFSSIGG